MIPYSEVPQTLTAIPQWLVWKLETRAGKETKLPYDAKSSGMGKFAATNDASTWAPFNQAVATATDPLSSYGGVGFVLTGTHLVGIDFDGVVHDGIPEPYVLNILEQLGNPYCEITPSGCGLRAFVECEKLPGKNRKFSGGHYGAEIYIGLEGGRYLTVTGDRLSGEGIPKIDDLSIPYFLITQIKNLKFKKLWVGENADYDNDQSRADCALAAMLARLLETQDAATIERYFSASVPGHREKWVERADYRKRTIEKIFEGAAKTTMVADEQTPKNKNTGGAIELVFKYPADTTTSIDEFLDNPVAGEKDGWFPLGSPSIVAGSSGSGKTSFMLQNLLAQKNRDEFFGHGTAGCSHLVLMTDRGSKSHRRTLRRMGLIENDIPIKFLSPLVKDAAALQNIVNEIEETVPMPQVVFVEGMDMLVTDGNKPQFVIPFMYGIQHIAERYNIAIIGSTGSPKTKEGQGYTQKRDNVSGSIHWGKMSETVANLEYAKGDDTVATRHLSVCLRNGPAETFDLIFDRGLLRIQTEADQQHTAKENKVLHWASDPTRPKWWTAMDLEHGVPMSRAGAWRWLQDALTKHWVIQKRGAPKAKSGRGEAKSYQWNKGKNNPMWVAPEPKVVSHFTKTNSIQILN